MRNVLVKLLAFGLVLLAVSPASAQFGVVSWGGFGGMQDTSTVYFLRTLEVAQQLNWTDEQIAAFNKVADKYSDAVVTAVRRGDQKKLRDLTKAASDEADKILKPDQAARLNQIKLQAAGVYAFQRDDVAAALKLSDKQKKAVAAQIDKLEKDVKALYDSQPRIPGLPGVPGGNTLETIRKAHDMSKNALDKAVNGLGKGQKKAWKEMTGETFELPPPPP